MSTQVIERPTKAPTAVEVFNDKLMAKYGELQKALKGSGIPVDRFIRTAVTAVQNNPALLTDCSFASLWNELQKACRDRLLPDGRQGVITIYNKRAKWQPMYRGMLDRFEQHPDYKWVAADVHRTDDFDWDVWKDETGQHFLHRPGPGLGEVIHTFACATTKTGAFFLSVVDEQDMQHIRSVSRAKSDDAPWQQWPDQMRMKTAIKRLCKLLPVPHELESLVLDDDEDDAPPIVPLAPVAKLARPRGAQAALDQFAGDENVRPEPEPEQPANLNVEDKAPDISQVRIETAHERGVEAKRTGMKRTAIPGEYRDAARGREAIAWRQGWDGEPLLDDTGADDASK